MANHYETRKYKRVKEDVRIKIDIIDSEKFSSGFEIAQAENISASGVLMRYDKPIDIGQIINISFLSPNSFEMISCKAVVVRVEITLENRYDIGVSFFDMSKTDKKRLNYYLTYL